MIITINTCIYLLMSYVAFKMFLFYFCQGFIMLSVELTRFEMPLTSRLRILYLIRVCHYIKLVPLFLS